MKSEPLECELCLGKARWMHLRCEDHPITLDPEALPKTRATLRRLIDAIFGQVGDDTVEESLEYMAAMKEARELLDSPPSPSVCGEEDVTTKRERTDLMMVDKRLHESLKARVAALEVENADLRQRLDIVRYLNERTAAVDSVCNETDSGAAHDGETQAVVPRPNTRGVLADDIKNSAGGVSLDPVCSSEVGPSSAGAEVGSRPVALGRPEEGVPRSRPSDVPPLNHSASCPIHDGKRCECILALYAKRAEREAPVGRSHPKEARTCTPGAGVSKTCAWYDEDYNDATSPGPMPASCTDPATHYSCCYSLAPCLNVCEKHACRCAQRTTKAEPPCSCEQELEKARAELTKLHWMRDVVGVDLERMYARALKEKDGREQHPDKGRIERIVEAAKELHDAMLRSDGTTRAVEYNAQWARLHNAFTLPSPRSETPEKPSTRQMAEWLRAYALGTKLDRLDQLDIENVADMFEALSTVTGGGE